MKKNALKRSIAGLFVGVSTFLVPTAISAAPQAAAIADECTKELLLSYFPQPIVTETLKRFNVPEDKWAGINKTLTEKDKEVVKLVEQKAAAMSSNPLKDPQQRQAAVKLFRDTLMEVFSAAMKANGVDDSSKYQAMLDDIQQQKAKKFAVCMDKKKAELKSADKADANGAASDSDEDSDDDDDYDDEDDNDDEDDEDDNDDEEDDKAASDSVGKDKAPAAKPAAKAAS